jgi:mannose-6-phosphate isomerase-like protein (cupin superfamily)
VSEPPFESAHLSELDAVPGPGTLTWRPIRRRFGIEAFGINAYTADAGKDVVENHTEETHRHQEVYFVAQGHATFTVAGESIDAPTGTFVFIRDVTVRRQAVAREDGTTVLAVGGRPGEPFEESAWEYSFAADPHIRAGDYEGGLAIMWEGFDRHREEGGYLYNLACFEALERDPRTREWAESDSDLDSIRDDPTYPG